ncbi:DMT family transporter [Actinomadura keratinilytica]
MAAGRPRRLGCPRPARGRRQLRPRLRLDGPDARRAGVPAIGLSAAQLTAATVLAALLLPWGGPPPRAPGAVPVLALLVLGIFATGVTFHLTYRTILAEGPTQAAAVGYLLPVVSVLLGAVVLGERVGWRVVVGMAVVLAGVVLTRWGAGARPKAPAGDDGERPEPLPAR